jgi:hypothetical protein
VSEAPVSLAFFDPARRLHGAARAGLTLLFEGGSPTTLPTGPEVERSAGGGFAARLEDRLELTLDPVSEPARLAGARTTLCRVRGRVGGNEVDCLGTTTETDKPPTWSELDVLRSLSVIVDEQNAVFLAARRPRDMVGHGHELVEAVLLRGGELHAVEDPRLSTVYDGEGRQRNAGLELWMPGEDFPRRVTGSAEAGASLELAGLRVHAAVFRWTMDGREGTGAYELAVRDEPEAA